MPESRAARKARLILHMDKDRVGLFVGGLAGLVVFAACVFWTQADLLEILFRVGLAAIVSYVAAFTLVYVIQMVAGPELRPKRSFIPLGPPGADENVQPAAPPGEEPK